MKLGSKRFLIMACCTLVAYFLITGPWDTGTVVDIATRKPIAGAVISVTWYGHIEVAVQGHSLCYATDTATTNEEGRYWIPYFSGNLWPHIRSRERGIAVIASGYRRFAHPGENAPTFSMVPYEGTPSEQFAYIHQQFTGVSCAGGKNAVPYLKAQHKELARLATTKEESEVVDGLLWLIESKDLGQEIADQKRVKRKQLSTRGEKR